MVLDAGEIAADQREQVGRLGMRIVPDREMAPVGQLAALGEIAVGEQHRRFLFVGLDARGVDRHHVGPVGEIGDAAEAFRLALRAIGAAGAVEAGELGVGGRVDLRHDFQREGAVGRLRDGELVGRHQEAVAFRARSPSSLSARSASPSPSSTSGAAGVAGLGLNLMRRAHPGSGSGAARRRDGRSPPASRAGGNLSGGWAGRYRCA